MFDIALQKDNPKFSKYSDLFDEDLYFSCVQNYISENNLDSNFNKIDVSQLDSAIYLVKIHTSQSTMTKRLVKY